MNTIAKNAASKTELRKFAWVMAGAALVFAGLFYWRGAQTAPLVLGAIAGLFLLFGLAAPLALGPVYKAWMRFALILAWINTRIILGLFFYLVLTPVSLVMRVIQRDILRRRFDRTGASYWHQRGAMKPAKESYEHLY
jgi:hypothetical protein